MPRWRWPAALAVLAVALGTSIAADAAAQQDGRGQQGLRWDIGGRLQLDHARFGGVYTDDGRQRSATYLRRAGLSGALHWQRRWSAALALERDTNAEVSVDTAWLRALILDDDDGGAARVELRAGRIDPDVGLEHATSSNWTWGIERSAIWDLAPDVSDSLAGTGVRADANGHHWHASAGLYDKRDHRAWAVRGAWVPLRGRDGWLHLGLSLAGSSGLEDDGRIRSRLGVRGVSEHGAGRRSTLAAAVQPQAFEGDRVGVAELAWRHGPWFTQAEWLTRRLAGRADQPDRRAQGAYLLLGRTLIGAARSYDLRRGRIGAPAKAGAGHGTLELFYRYDHLEARDDGTGAGGGGAATQASVHALGLSWFAPRHWRASLDLGVGRSDDPNDAGQGSGRSLALRLQATF